MPSRRQAAGMKWSLYPSLHEDVSSLISEDNLSFTFYENDDPMPSVKEYDTNIMGKFTCDNNACSSSGWSSKKIAITIRMYSGSQYNARVYHQRCKGCNRLSRPTLDSSYADRVAYRLKKWSGISVESAPSYRRESKGPHQSNLCEGCKNGRCKELD